MPVPLTSGSFEDYVAARWSRLVRSAVLILVLDPQTGETLRRSEEFDGFVLDAAYVEGGIHVVLSGMLGNSDLVGQSQVVDYDGDFTEVRRSPPIVGDGALTGRS